MRVLCVLLWTLGLTLVATPPVAAAVPTDLRWLAPILGQLTPDVPVRLHVPQQVMTATRPGFTDLRLFDDQGLETPYVIYAQSAPPSLMFVFKVLSYHQSDAGDTIILQRPPDTGPFWELTVRTTAGDFHKLAHLQASHDRLTWADVTTDALFDFSSRIDVRKTTLTFPETDAPYVRLLLNDVAPAKSDATTLQLRYDGLDFAVRGAPAQPFRIDQISGRAGSAQAVEHVYDRTTVVPPGTRTDAQGNTLVLLGRVHLPIAQVTLGVDNPYFHRRVELWAADTDTDDAYRQVTSGTIYKLPGMAASDTRLRVSPPSTYAYVRLKILNSDNPPLRLQQVELAWVRQHLYFIPTAGRHYTLYFGAEEMRAPVYELQRLLPAQHARLEHYAAVSLGDVQPHPHYKARPSQDSKQVEKTLLTVGVLVLAGALGLWAYRLLKTVTRMGA